VFYNLCWTIITWVHNLWLSMSFPSWVAVTCPQFLIAWVQMHDQVMGSKDETIVITESNNLWSRQSYMSTPVFVYSYLNHFKQMQVYKDKSPPSWYWRELIQLWLNFMMKEYISSPCSAMAIHHSIFKTILNKPQIDHLHVSKC